MGRTLLRSLHNKLLGIQGNVVQMNLILFITFRISIILGLIISSLYLLNPIAQSYNLRITDWEIFIFIIPIVLLPLWLFDKLVPAKCTECGKVAFYIAPLSYYTALFTCKACGSVVSSPLGK